MSTETFLLKDGTEVDLSVLYEAFCDICDGHLEGFDLEDLALCYTTIEDPHHPFNIFLNQKRGTFDNECLLELTSWIREGGDSSKKEEMIIFLDGLVGKIQREQLQRDLGLLV